MNTGQRQVDFLTNEVLEPFAQSSLYDDYKNEFDERTDPDCFDVEFRESMALLQSIPALLEAAERVATYIPDDVSEFELDYDFIRGLIVRAQLLSEAIKQVKGEHHG